MAIQQIDQALIQSEKFARTREFLQRFGIAPGRDDHLIEEDVRKAIRARGWEPSLRREKNPPGWLARITEWRTLTASQSVFAEDPDRLTALIKALQIALSWPTREEEIRAFDAQTRDLLGMSAEDFMAKWHADELDTSNPVVVHLLIARPLGW